MVKGLFTATRATETQDNYQGTKVFKHVEIRLVAFNEPFMGCGPLPDWLRKKCCIYAIDTIDGNMRAWSCLIICMQRDTKRDTEFVTKVALNLAPEYYDNSNLKRRELRPTFADFEGIAKHHQVNTII